MQRTLRNQFDETQMRFINVFYIEQKNVSETAIILKMSENTVRLMKKKFKDLKAGETVIGKSFENVIEGRDKWKSKKIGGNFWDFYNWYLTADKKCYYCKLTEKKLAKLHEIGIVNKRKTRGQKLEIDRKIANEEYQNISNLTYSCYWCNNAKTDTFTEDEFIKIGKTIGLVWEERLKVLGESELTAQELKKSTSN